MPIGDDKRGIAAHAGKEPGSNGLLTPMGGAVGPKHTEGGGIGAALGGEVPGEAEHVCPRGQAQGLQPGDLAEPDAFSDMSAGMLADRQRIELVSRGDAAVESASAFRGQGNAPIEARGQESAQVDPGGLGAGQARPGWSAEPR